MALSPTTKLGPYEVTDTLGAGGMGEVYRARDTRLGREVAIKILPSSLATDALPLRRFEQEARAVAALNHPNILVVYDVGTYRPPAFDGTAAVATLEECSYIVSELLEGETLRERLRAGPLPVRKVIDYARQIASGLAAAHDKGIVHRDLKPENIFITNDGRVKILDFGLAKLTQPDSVDGQTLSGFVESKVGTVLGTVGYMSPEQVRGRATDARSDLFSFGAILYEMLSGRRAFQGDSVAETMSAILKEDPPDLTATNRAVPPSLEFIVRHCLEKNPVERLQSARDAGFDLGLISGDSVAASTARVRTPSKRRLYLATFGLLAAALLVAAFFIGRKTAPKPNDASYHQLTFRRGLVTSALFAPEGHTVLYAADWEGTGHQLYAARDDTRSSLPLGLQNADVLGISPSGEVAVLQNPKRLQGWCNVGTLSMTSVNGGAPRPVLEDVGAVAWAPDGITFAVVRYVDKRYRLEYPIGKTIFTTNGWISSPRFSPKGDLIAFLHHPVFGDDRGEVAVVDKAGHARVVAKGFASTQGLAWMPSTSEIWFTASDTGTLTALRAVTRDGKSRVVTRSPGRLLLQDIAQDGRVLITEESARRVILVSAPGRPERDVALLDWSLLRAISNDGKSVLLTEEGEGGGPNYSVYLRNLIDGSAIRLGDGEGWALSPDGKFVLAASLTAPRTVLLLPTGAGEPRILNVGNINFDFGTITPDGNSIVFSGTEQSMERRVYAMDLKGGAPRPITPPGVGGPRIRLVSRDSKSVLLYDDDKWWLYPVSGAGQPQEAKGLESGDDLAGWSTDSNVVYAGPQVEIPAKIYRVNIVTGQRNFCCQFAPSDPTGMRGGVGPIIVNPEKQLSAFGFSRRSSNLYLMDAPK